MIPALFYAAAALLAPPAVRLAAVAPAARMTAPKMIYAMGTDMREPIGSVARATTTSPTDWEYGSILPTGRYSMNSGWGPYAGGYGMGGYGRYGGFGGMYGGYGGYGRYGGMGGRYGPYS